MPVIKDTKVDEQIHAGRREKLRKRYANFGLESFAEHEVLEFALGFVFKQGDTNPTAHRLINQFGSLYNICNTHPEQLKKVLGVGEQAAFFLNFLSQFTNYYNASGVKGVKEIKSTAEALNFLLPITNTLDKEQFFVICLGSGNKILHAQKIATGTANKVYVDIRNITETILRFPTVSVIVAHNHPMGSATPSPSDNRVTRMLVYSLMPMNIDVMDHIVIGENNSFYSYYKQGELNKIKLTFLEENNLQASANENVYS